MLATHSQRLFSTTIILLLALCALLPGRSAVADTAIFKHGEAGIFQVRILNQQTERRSSLGSGFLAQRGDWLITNYHVISSYIDRPELYRIVVHSPEGKIFNAEVLAIDVPHDLAILKLPQALGTPYELGPAPHKGQRLFAMGNPLDMGITLSEGTNNGDRNHEGDPNLLLSMTLNGGMSGGPTFDEKRRVIGVNVARAGDDLSLIIPSRLVQALLDQASADDYQIPENFQTEIARQVKAHLKPRFERLLAKTPEAIDMHGFQLPAAFDSSIRCWDSSSKPKDDDLLTDLETSCRNRHGIYVTGRVRMGRLTYQYVSLQSKGLHPLRFARYYQDRNNSQLGNRADKTSHTPFACQTEFVDIARHPFKTTYCRRDYKRYPGLSDVMFTAALVGSEGRGMLLVIDQIGTTPELGIETMRRILKEIQWQKS